MPSLKAFLTLCAAIFAFIALAHLARAIAQWPIVIGPWYVPVAPVLARRNCGRRRQRLGIFPGAQALTG